MTSRKRERSRLTALNKAAKRGDVSAYHDLGAFYATDEVLGVKDLSRAVKWYTMGAEQNDGLCQYDLGFMLLLGEGKPKDQSKGLWWLERSFENSASVSARLLGEIYSEGHFGVAPDPKLAAYWEKMWDDSRAQQT